MLKYSISTKVFYDVSLNYLTLPDDLVDIDDDTHNRIIQRTGDEEFYYENGEFIIYKKDAPNEDTLINNKKIFLLSDIEDRISNIIKITTGNPNPEEKSTWSLKLSIANNYLNNQSTKLDLLFFQEANLTNDKLKKDWSTKVIDKAKYYSIVIGSLEALKINLKSKLKSIDNLENLFLLEVNIKDDFNNLLQKLKEME